LVVVQDVCATVGVEMPTSVFTNINANRTMQEMVALANEVAQRIAYDTREWTKLKLQQVFAGDGVATGFNLPANYKRMLFTASVWRSTSTQQPMEFVNDTDVWLRRRAANEYNAWGEWTLLGEQMLIYPAMGVSVTARFPYLDRNCVRLNAGGYGERCVTDADSYRLDERLLKLGMVWQWKAQKGSPYAEDMGTFGDALQIAMGADKPAPIMVDRVPLSMSARIAYPWQVPT